MQEPGCRIDAYETPRKEIDIWVKEEICFHFFPSTLYGEREIEKGKPINSSLATAYQKGKFLP